MKNKIMLITYADSFGRNLKELNQVLDLYFRKEIGAIHILPFFSFIRRPGVCSVNV